ncbi:HNH endonuclease [Actinomadura sp. GTD37]|uniref:HNH endonuclease n=1 Tax=Actinomadura sp. GTD37 TaxID=1778030 RepID=UPI0035C1818C
MHTSTKLTVGEVVRYPEPPNQEPEYLDGCRNFFNLTAAPGAPRLIMNRGIDHPAAVSAPEGKRRPVILLRSNPFQAGSTKTPWRDVIDLTDGKVRYYGDHRANTTGPLGSTRGNAALLRAVEDHTSDKTEIRRKAVPLLIFRSIEQNRQIKGFLQFCGLGVIDGAEAVRQEDPASGKYFPNYVFNISLLNLSLEGNEIDWRWINARRDSTVRLDETIDLAPHSWASWISSETSKGSRTESSNTSTQRSPDWVWDELVLACALVHRNSWREVKNYDSRAIELSNLLQKLPFHPLEIRGNDFRSPSSVQRKTADFATAHPDYKGTQTRGGRKTRQVIDAFLANPQKMLAAADRITEVLNSGDDRIRDAIATPGSDENEVTALEGRSLERVHRYRERDHGLRQKKIKNVLSSGGELSCEVCGFDFTKVYGEHGDGYIEVHHVVPLHEAGEAKTSLSDLALLCANCHRMSHRRLGATSTWPSPEELRDLVREFTHSERRRNAAPVRQPDKARLGDR